MKLFFKKNNVFWSTVLLLTATLLYSSFVGHTAYQNEKHSRAEQFQTETDSFYASINTHATFSQRLAEADRERLGIVGGTLDIVAFADKLFESMKSRSTDFSILDENGNTIFTSHRRAASGTEVINLNNYYQYEQAASVSTPTSTRTLVVDGTPLTLLTRSRITDGELIRKALKQSAVNFLAMLLLLLTGMWMHRQKMSAFADGVIANLNKILNEDKPFRLARLEFTGAEAVAKTIASVKRYVVRANRDKRRAEREKKEVQITSRKEKESLLASQRSQRLKTAFSKEISERIRLVYNTDTHNNISIPGACSAIIDMKTVDISAIVKTCCDMFHDDISQRNITLNHTIEDGVFSTTDAFCLNVIMANVLAQSIASTPDHGAIDVQVHADIDNVLIKISDNSVSPCEWTLPATLKNDALLGLTLSESQITELIKRMNGKSFSQHVFGKGFAKSFHLPLASMVYESVPKISSLN